MGTLIDYYLIELRTVVGLKFVIFINLVGCDLLPNALIFDTFLDAIMTIIVPTVSNYFAVTTGDSKIIFYVNCGAAALW